MDWFQIALRKVSPIQCAPPATARQSSTVHRFGAKAAEAVATPTRAAESTTSRPCRCTRSVQPPVAAAVRLPTALAE